MSSQLSSLSGSETLIFSCVCCARGQPTDLFNSLEISMFTYKFVMDIPINLVSLFRVVIHRMTFTGPLQWSLGWLWHTFSWIELSTMFRQCSVFWWLLFNYLAVAIAVDEISLPDVLCAVNVILCANAWTLCVSMVCYGRLGLHLDRVIPKQLLFLACVAACVVCSRLQQTEQCSTWSSSRWIVIFWLRVYSLLIYSPATKAVKRKPDFSCLCLNVSDHLVVSLLEYDISLSVRAPQLSVLGWSTPGLAL